VSDFTLETEVGTEAKNALPPKIAEVAEVTSNFPSVGVNFRERKRKSLATSANGSGSPLSKRERVEGEGELKPSPPPLSLITLPKPKTSVASYAGAISRWCDLHNRVPDATGGADKQAAELAAFEQWLSEVAAERQRIKALQF
jgi:hypothetical protein